MDREAWWATVHGITKSQTRLKRLRMHTSIESFKENLIMCSARGNVKSRESILLQLEFPVEDFFFLCQVDCRMSFRQEYWSGWPFPSSGDLPDPGIQTRSPALQADSLPPELPGKPCMMIYIPENIKESRQIQLLIKYNFPGDSPLSYATMSRTGLFHSYLLASNLPCPFRKAHFLNVFFKTFIRV